MGDNAPNDGLTSKQRAAICAVLSRYPEVESACLYGSRALGRHKPGSDIDLTLYGSIDLPKLNQISLELDDLLLPMIIDLSVFQHIENPELLDQASRKNHTAATDLPQ